MLISGQALESSPPSPAPPPLVQMLFDSIAFVLGKMAPHAFIKHRFDFFFSGLKVVGYCNKRKLWLISSYSARERCAACLRPVSHLGDIDIVCLIKTCCFSSNVNNNMLHFFIWCFLSITRLQEKWTCCEFRLKPSSGTWFAGQPETWEATTCV